MHRWWWWW
uniref:Uncharacterized protein n=1 Tax=Arundo donax TaxID=35708 RepID=A0A0A9A1J4_ARUDO